MPTPIGRILQHGPAGPVMNMAIDEALLRECDAGLGNFPVVRFYWWSVPTLSLGAKERLEEAADINFCNNNGIGLVQRTTGGRAVLHEHELTYSIIAPLNKKPFCNSVEESYLNIASALRDGLSQLGLKLDLTAGSRKIRPRTLKSFEGKSDSAHHLPCFAAPSRYELAFAGKKVIGSAQRRFRNAVLQHGSILLTVDAEKLAGATGSGQDSINELNSTMVGIESILGRNVKRDELIPGLANALKKALSFSGNDGELSESERNRLPELIKEIKNRIDMELPDYG